MVQKTEEFIVQLDKAVKAVNSNASAFISKQSLRTTLSTTSKKWLQELSPRVRATSNISETVINDLDNSFEKLLELATSSNRKSTHLILLKAVARKIQQDVLVPLIKSTPTSSLLDGIVARVLSQDHTPEQKRYLDEAFRAARAGCFKAAVVMTWCAAIDRLQSYVIARGLSVFSQTSSRLKQITAGPYKRFSKEFVITMENELREEVFDKDLILVISGMNGLDFNQVRALNGLFDKRNSSAHPSATDVNELAYSSFLNDVNNLVFANPKLVATT